MPCQKLPVSCRKDLASLLGLTPRKSKPWQYDGTCPSCGHGGYGLTAGTQGTNPPRHIWFCNCRRCHCSPEQIRTVMLAKGASPDCLGAYGKTSSNGSSGSPGKPPDETAVLRAAMREVLSDPKLRALADIKIRMLEVIEGRSAPGDWDGFIDFAKRAGVQRSKRYDAAERWGRSATAVVEESK